MMKLNRRSLLKAAGLATGVVVSGGLPALASVNEPENSKGKKLALKVAHITDVHIRDGEKCTGKV